MSARVEGTCDMCACEMHFLSGVSLQLHRTATRGSVCQVMGATMLPCFLVNM